MIEVTPQISVRQSELQMRFVLAGGPGGQNVNKVATAVELRFDVTRSADIKPAVAARLRGLAGRRMTAGGVIIIRASRFRSQDRNRQDAVNRLFSLIREAATPPKYRRATRVGTGAKLRRRTAKKQRGDLKRLRSRITDKGE